LVFFTTAIPVISQPPEERTVTSNDNVTFVCTVTSKPQAIIYWIRNNTVLISNISLSDGGVPFVITISTIGNCTPSNSPSQCASSSTLQILSTRAVDSGEYTCVATNKAGSDTATVQLIVNDKHHLTILYDFDVSPELWHSYNKAN